MRALRFLLVLAVLLLAAPALADGPFPVVRVIDGDTLVVRIDGKLVKVRMIGVDTPETVDPRKPVQFFGKEASAFTRLLLTGESVDLEYDWNRKDRYGRTLAFVYRHSDGLFVNREIVVDGFGHAYLKFPFDKTKMADFKGAEREAREAKRNLWAAR